MLVDFHVFWDASFKKSTFEGLIRKKWHIDRKLGGGGADAPSDPPSPCSGGPDLPLQSKQKETQKKKFMFCRRHLTKTDCVI